MSGPLGDKQQKRGENVENIKCSLDTQLNFMFSTYSPIFCCLSTRRPDVRKVGEKLYSDFSEILEMEQNAPCFSPHSF